MSRAFIALARRILPNASRVRGASRLPRADPRPHTRARRLARASMGACRQPIDESALLSYCRDRVRDFPSACVAIDVTQFGHGQSNPTYKVVALTSRGDACGTFVLRKKPPGALLRSAHAVEREFAVIDALQRTNVPVPLALALCEDDRVLGEAFYLMSYVDGEIYLRPGMEHCGARRRRAVYRAMAESLGALHSVSPRDVGLENFGRAERYSERQVERWFKQYEASVGPNVGVEAEQSVIALVAWLRANVPKSEISSRLVHGDFRLDNLVLTRSQDADDDNVKVLAVLDWELSTIGAPYADVAFNCLSYYLPPGIELYPTLDPSALPSGIPSEQEYVSIWARASGLPDPLALGNTRMWPFYIALSLFRGAAILAGVRARALQGNASSANAYEMGKLVDVFAKRALMVTVGVSVPRGVSELSSLDRSSTSSASIIAGFEPSAKAAVLLHKLEHFMHAHVYKAEEELEAHAITPDRWSVSPVVESLKSAAKAAGLWNLWLPLDSAALLKITPRDGTDATLFAGPGLTNLEYAHLAEVMGRSVWASEAFNCSAPDTGNMEVLLRYGTMEQQERWLRPLLTGDIRSCFAMTEPAVASSDATNIESAIVRDGTDYVLNGRKWWTSGACDPRCKVIIFMGKTTRDGSGIAKHRQQSMVLCPMDAPGVTVIRPLTVFGYDDAPHGHAEMTFDDVRVKAEASILLGEGRGFEIAQGRLGPGRLHHCMRLIGMGERALEIASERAKKRVAFGAPLARNGNVLQRLGQCRVTLDGARLLTLQAAHALDVHGIKVARGAVAACKVAAPAASISVIDTAIQIHGGAGVSQDTPLARLYAGARTLRLADGPDEVHLETIAKMELRRSKL